MAAFIGKIISEFRVPEYKIINDLQGELNFESEPGRGTIATIILPASGV